MPRRISNGRSRSGKRSRLRRRWQTRSTTSATRSRRWGATTRRCSGTCARSIFVGRQATGVRAPSRRTGIGTIFDYQGRYGSAVKSKGEALQAFRDLKQRDVWLGRDPERLWEQPEPQRAHWPTPRLRSTKRSKLANELKNANLVAQTLRFQADSLYYSGDLKGASELGKQVRRPRRALRSRA